MEHIIQQIQELESLNKREEEKIEQERCNHHESSRAKERVLIEMDELEKRNQALCESIFQFDVNLDGTRQQNNDVKLLLKESKLVSNSVFVDNSEKRLRHMQNQLEQRKGEVEGIRGEVATKIYEINIRFAAKIKENSLGNVIKQVETLKKKFTELKRREELKKKFEPIEELERLSSSISCMEKEEADFDVVLSSKADLIEQKKMELDLLSGELRQCAEKVAARTEQDMNIDYSLLVEANFSDQVSQNVVSSFLEEKSKLLVIRERLAEEDGMASALEVKFEKTAEKTQELSKTLSGLNCSKCSISMTI
ncbi:predicted protein [Naegleria gruberi]|uniref:Predicted protein n=1 Tax=Naegleria gruberi TaxID=5762 RepID=D2UXV5_NAEGR|nr:uncharacterized protein NAEGRDRAFT_45029 [Naegleria gruberi]EFC50695.1 predicted protein [Naegleria gruberi]|eukprot:XP_002683439.1 predicted protein [Naegleria gruberi strain NEG-M]